MAVFRGIPGEWQTKRILVTVKSYPRPSRSLYETVCVAGVTDDGEWIRLYPVTFRLLPEENQFDKYDWIEVQVRKSKRDYRAETFEPDVGSIRKVGRISTDLAWSERKQLLCPKLDPSIEALRATNRSLGFIRPAHLSHFLIHEETEDKPDAEQQRATRQLSFLFPDVEPVERLARSFRYGFKCTDDCSSFHDLKIVDWEVFQSYRKWRDNYGPGRVDELMQRKYWEEFRGRDLCLFVGTPLAQDHLRSFIIIGLFYPPKAPFQPVLNLHGER